MASSPEFSLSQKLRARVPTEDILNDWLQELSLTSPKKEECLSFFVFAYNSGHWNKVLEALPLFLSKRWPIHWGVLTTICEDGDLDAEEEVVASVLKGARKQNLVELLVLSRAWDMKAPEIISFRTKVTEKIVSESRRQKETLREKLGFLRTQRMVEEEGKLLKILQRMYPADKEIEKELEEYQERWARHLLSSRSEQKGFTGFEESFPSISPEEKRWAEVLMADMIKIAHQKPTAAYWFAIALHMMGFHLEGLRILEESPDSAKKDWLYLELLLKARRFVEVLSLSQSLEVHYSADPEASFALHYARALAMKGLGQDAQAIELLRSLIAIRPSYRSAHSLLSAWLGERA